MTIYYVSPLGSDSNSGLSPGLAWCTPAHAAANSAAGDTIIFRGGTYPLTAAIALTSANNNQTWTHFGNEVPIFDGGTAITGWEQTDASYDLWSAVFSGAARNLYIDGVRCNRARVELTTTGWGTSATGYTSTGGTANGYANPADIELIYRQRWIESRVPVTAVASTTITAASPAITSVFARMDFLSWSRLPTHLENAYEVLVGSRVRNTHYIDKTNDVAYIIRPLHANMATASIVAATMVDQMLTITNATGITISGIVFQHNQWSQPGTSEGFSETQANTRNDSTHAANPTPNGTWPKATAAIEISGCTDVSIVNCQLLHLGTAGISVWNGSQDCTINGNILYDLSSTGIQIGDPSEINPTTPTSGTTVSNNLVKLVGQEFPGAVCYIEWYPADTTTTGNEFSYSNYSLSSRGWGWGNTGTTTNKRSGNTFANNRIHDGMRQLADGGAQYENGKATSDICTGNILYNVNSTFARGIYTDDGCSGRTFTNYVIKDIVDDGSPEWSFANNNALPGNSFDIIYADTSNKGLSGSETNTFGTVTVSADPFVDGATIVSAAGLSGAYATRDQYATPSLLRASRAWDASTDRLTSSSFSTLSSEGTLAVWYTPHWDTASQTRVLVSIPSTVSGNFTLEYDSSDNINAGWFKSGGFVRLSVAASGKFHRNMQSLLVLRWSASVMDLWLNGSKIGTVSSPTVFTVDGGFNLGSYAHSIGDGFYAAGILHNVAVWNASISDAEVAQLQYLPAPAVNSSALTNFWPINGSSPEPDTIGGKSLTATGTAVAVIQELQAVSITSGTNPSNADTEVAFSISVKGGPSTPTGTVRLLQDGVPIGDPATLDGSGNALIDWTFLGTGTYAITAAYSGDASHAAETSAVVSQAVNINPLLGPHYSITLLAPATNVKSGVSNGPDVGTMPYGNTLNSRLVNAV